MKICFWKTEIRDLKKYRQLPIDIISTSIHLLNSYWSKIWLQKLINIILKSMPFLLCSEPNTIIQITYIIFLNTNYRKKNFQNSLYSNTITLNSYFIQPFYEIGKWKFILTIFYFYKNDIRFWAKRWNYLCRFTMMFIFLWKLGILQL